MALVEVRENRVQSLASRGRSKLKKESDVSRHTADEYRISIKRVSRIEVETLLRMQSFCRAGLHICRLHAPPTTIR
jgi:hypothetical protein